MKLLVIQTSFLGDVIAATAVIEKLHQHYPNDRIDMLVRGGNESLLEGHPFLGKVWVWEKRKNKIGNLLKIASQIRKEKYHAVINLHRFFSTGIITAYSRADNTRGFDKNPLSFLFNKKFVHRLGDGTTEYQRNQSLIADLTDQIPAKPRLYPTNEDVATVLNFKPQTSNFKPFFTISPASVWFTKQLPISKWLELIELLPQDSTIFLLGAKNDFGYAEQLKTQSKHPGIVNLSGKLTLLQSAALMKDAKMNYVNDSAPMHLASAMNAPVTAFYLSTTPQFGFVPVSDSSTIVETKVALTCRPCGTHGLKSCPEGHFKCALTIEMKSAVIDFTD